METILVANVGFSVRVRNLLRKLNITTLNEIATMTERELWVTDGLGLVSLGEVKNALTEHGLKFAEE